VDYESMRKHLKVQPNRLYKFAIQKVMDAGLEGKTYDQKALELVESGDILPNELAYLMVCGISYLIKQHEMEQHQHKGIPNLEWEPYYKQDLDPGDLLWLEKEGMCFVGTCPATGESAKICSIQSGWQSQLILGDGGLLHDIVGHECDRVKYICKTNMEMEPPYEESVA
jgi:hypothetical protein